jgi:hypothetical protein
MSQKLTGKRLKKEGKKKKNAPFLDPCSTSRPLHNCESDSHISQCRGLYHHHHLSSVESSSQAENLENTLFQVTHWRNTKFQTGPYIR